MYICNCTFSFTLRMCHKPLLPEDKWQDWTGNEDSVHLHFRGYHRHLPCSLARTCHLGIPEVPLLARERETSKNLPRLVYHLCLHWAKCLCSARHFQVTTVFFTSHTLYFLAKQIDFSLPEICLIIFENFFICECCQQVLGRVFPF